MSRTNDEGKDMEFLLWRWATYRPWEERAALKAKVRAEIVSLRLLEREVILCHFWDDLTIPEIADHMGLGEGSVRKLLEMGLSTLKRKLVSSSFGKDFVAI